MSKRLAIVTHNVIKGDGQGRANYEIARHALAHGYDVTLLADRVEDDLAAMPGLRWIPVQPKVRGNWLIHGLEFVARVRPLLQRMRREFDIIHGYGYTLDTPHQVNTSQFVHSAWRRSPMHVARQHRNAYGAYQWLYSALNAAGEKRAYRQAQVVVAASSTVRQELLDLGVPADRLKVILNGANPAEFYPGEVSRTALGLPEGVPLALFAGDIRTNRKNLDTVLKAMVEADPNVNLAVVGRLEGSPFPQMAQDLGVAGRVHFLDFRRDMADIMRASDMFVFPSRYEACALVLVEAITSGLPVITAKTTGGSEVVTPQSGITLDNPDDVSGLTRAINTLAADPDQRRSMSAAARRESERYTWDKIAGSYLDVYREWTS